MEREILEKGRGLGEGERDFGERGGQRERQRESEKEGGREREF